MSELCCECGKKAVFQDGTRLPWCDVIPPDEDAVFRKDWFREHGYDKIHFKSHCEQHHKQHLAKYGEQTISFILDHDLMKRLHLVQVAPHPRIYFPQGYYYEDEEAGGISE